MSGAQGAIETPSGKGAADENFPVGSWLLPRRLRPHVAVFYAFARAIDDIADNPALAPEDKVARLDRFADALRPGPRGSTAEAPGLAKAHAMRDTLAVTGITAQHCLDLISAFKQDAVKTRYRDWAELIDYCDRSAAPVGRFLLDLHGEDPAGYPASDALCNALQMINHLQDCADDYAGLDRVYLPTEWLEAEGLDVDVLGEPAMPPGLRRVVDRCLEGTRALLATADTLPGALRSRRLAMESAVIVKIAHALCGELARRDPLADRVVLTRGQTLRCAVAGVMGAVLR
ncbi:squalene synthase HpnC [Kaustia mangrovi]|uniref:Squalene synthase HpnC n=1 Tax=Kaustia mangrovi TaxID=2593653 RepID=A0A7S8C6V7_9HYPH|nr:squalene synthase HpnC [Kaustia mangrovi]QPC44422.1 squalene synthase HpnC [Kaustia mangrovi]